MTFDLCGGLITIGYGAAQLWALYGERGSRVFSPRYAHEAQQDPRPVPWATSPFFWLPFVFIALLVLVFFAVVAVGVMR